MAQSTQSSNEPQQKVKDEHLRHKIDVLIENKKSPYKYHKIMKSKVLRKVRHCPPLIIGEDIISDDDRKVEALNDYFCSQTNISIQNNHMSSYANIRQNTSKPRTHSVLQKLLLTRSCTPLAKLTLQRLVAPISFPPSLSK